MMPNDIFHISLKEIKELRNNKAFLMYYLYIIFLGGVMIPLFTEFNTSVWGVSIYLLMIVCFIGVIVPSTLVSDTFAGEKERKTFEALISTPVSIFSLFLGKAIFILFTTSSIISIVYVINRFVYGVIGLVKMKQFINPFNTVSHIVFWGGSLGIALFVTFVGSMISINARNIKSCNLAVMLLTSPVLVPIMYILSQETLKKEWLLIFIGILLGVAILIGIGVKVKLTKVKMMNKLR